MEKIKVRYDSDGSVLTITLDDGKGNVLDHVMIEDIQSVLDTLRDKPHVKVIVFEGAGKNFSFGASVAEHRKDSAAAMLNQLHKLLYSIKDHSIPTVAKVSGQCLGGGLELALMCNFIFCDESARLGQPEILLGVFPPAASVLLPEKIGSARAEDILITGRIFHAIEGKEIGLVNEVFDSRELLDTGVKEWIEKNILPRSASSLRHAVKAARIKFNHIFSNFIPQVEYNYINKLMETRDANEGIESFLEKRKAVWSDN